MTWAKPDCSLGQFVASLQPMKEFFMRNFPISACTRWSRKHRQQMTKKPHSSHRIGWVGPLSRSLHNASISLKVKSEFNLARTTSWGFGMLQKSSFQKLVPGGRSEDSCQLIPVQIATTIWIKPGEAEPTNLSPHWNLTHPPCLWKTSLTRADLSPMNFWWQTLWNKIKEVESKVHRISCFFENHFVDFVGSCTLERSMINWGWMIGMDQMDLVDIHLVQICVWQSNTLATEDWTSSFDPNYELRMWNWAITAWDATYALLFEQMSNPRSRWGK